MLSHAHIAPGPLRWMQTICEAIDQCGLVVVLGTTTYGRSTTSFSTYHEINYTFDEQKPFYLVKSTTLRIERRMKPPGADRSRHPSSRPRCGCTVTERWEEVHVRMKFGQRTMYTLWMPGDPMPEDLISNIVAK